MVHKSSLIADCKPNIVVHGTTIFGFISYLQPPLMGASMRRTAHSNWTAASSKHKVSACSSVVLVSSHDRFLLVELPLIFLFLYSSFFQRSSTVIANLIPALGKHPRISRGFTANWKQQIWGVGGGLYFLGIWLCFIGRLWMGHEDDSRSCWTNVLPSGKSKLISPAMPFHWTSFCAK